MTAPFVDPKAWRREALAYHLGLIEQADPEYAMRAADDAEKASEGVLSGLGARVREAVAARRAKGAKR